MTMLALVALLLAAPVPAKPADPAAAAAAAEAAAKAAAEQRAADAARAEQLQKAVEAAQKAAEAAAKAAEAAQKAAEAVAAKVAPPAATAAAAPPPPAAPAAPPPVAWSGLLSAGLIFVSGNSNSVTALASGKLERKGPEWTIGLKAGGAYGQATIIENGVEKNQTSALNGMIGARADRKLGDVFALFVAATVDTDHLKNIQWRPIGELGVAMTWFDVKEGDLAKTSLRTDLGLQLGKEFRRQYPDDLEFSPNQDQTIAAPRLGIAFRYAVTKDVIFTEDLGVAIAIGINEQKARTLTTSLSKLMAKVTDASALGISFGFLNDSVPVAGKKNTDLTLAVTLDVSL